MEWLGDNWVLVLALAGALLGVAKVAVKFTKTEKDDEIVDAVDKVFESFRPGGPPSSPPPSDEEK